MNKTERKKGTNEQKKKERKNKIERKNLPIVKIAEIREQRT